MTRRKSPLESYQTDPVDDPEAPELSEENFERMRPASELPKKMLDSFPRAWSPSEVTRGTQGPGDAETPPNDCCPFRKSEKGS